MKKKLFKKIYLLDCTFRDGGYYNNWKFKKRLINQYFKVMQSINIDYIEIGFRFCDYNKNYGALAYTSDRFLNSLNIPSYFDRKIAVMINTSDFKNNLEDKINRLFILKKNSKVTLVRIATHFHEIQNSITLLNILQKKGYQVCLNLMQISEYNDDKIKLICNLLKKNKRIKILYIADSLGILSAEHLSKIVKKIKKNIKINVGVHCHDNLSNALSNSQSGMISGANFIDSTIRGIGRGAGNLKTEFAIPIFKKKINILNLLKLIKFSNGQFKNLEKIFSWGPSIFYLLSAIYKIHPTYIQNAIAKANSDDLYILNVINYLKNKKSILYKKNLNNLLRVKKLT